MTKIYLMRHGYAERNAPGGDAARQLTPMGIDFVKSTVLVLARMDVTPARIYCSPRVRAQQTAEIVGAAIGMTPITRESVNFDFEVGVVKAAMEETPAEDLMFVGHEPTISEVLHSLTRANAIIEPGTVAAVQVGTMGDASGHLLWLMSPDIATALTEPGE